MITQIISGFMFRRGVFKIINNVTGKVYIGSSDTNMDNLIYGYWQKLKSGVHHNKELQRDFDYYGSSNFDFIIVKDDCRSEEEVRLLREREIYLNSHNTYNEDVPVHYSGGNPNASYGGYSRKQNNIKDDLNSLLVGPNLSSYNRRNLKNRIDSGSIRTVEQLKNEIKKIEINSNYFDDDKIKMLADTYCAFTEFGLWNRDKETIIFERKHVYFSPEESKQINIKDLSKEIDTIRRQILYSPPNHSSIKMNVYQLSSLFCKLYGFKSFKLIDCQHIRFDEYHKISISSFEKIIKLTCIMSEDKSPEAHEQEMENRLNQIIRTEYFEQSLERLINEYCEYYKIKSWDLIGNNEVLFFKEYIRISSVNEVIDALYEKQKDLTQKLGVLDLRNIYNVFKRRKNDNGHRTASVDSLLSILFKSDLTISDKFNLRKEINHGRIKTKNGLYFAIDQCNKCEIVNQRRKINYVNPQDKFYNIKLGKYVLEDENSKSNESSVNSTNSVQKTCPNCGNKVKKGTVICLNCNYYFKQGKIIPKHTKDENKRENTEDNVKLKNFTSDNSLNGNLNNFKNNKLKKCPNCGTIIKKNTKKCVRCNLPINQMNTKQNIKLTKTKNNNSHSESNKKNKKQIFSKKHKFKIQMSNLYIDGKNTHLGIRNCKNIIEVMTHANDENLTILELTEKYYFISSHYIKIVAENYNNPDLTKLLK